MAPGCAHGPSVAVGANWTSPTAFDVSTDPLNVAVWELSNVHRVSPGEPAGSPEFATNISPHGLKVNAMGSCSSGPVIWPLAVAVPEASIVKREMLLAKPLGTKSSPHGLIAIPFGLLSPLPVMVPFGTALPAASKR